MRVHVLAAAAGLLLGGAAWAAKSDYKITIVNESSWEIHRLYLSSVNDNEWGPDQLGDKVITTGGGKFTLHSIPCGAYDINVVDEDGDQCILNEVQLCGGTERWVVTDEVLLGCQANSQ